MDLLISGHVDFLFSAEGALLLEDVICWGNWYSEIIGISTVRPESAPEAFDRLFLTFAEFRSLCDYRTSGRTDIHKFRSEEFPRATELHIKCPSIGPRFRIQHGHNTYVFAREIGSDFWVNHNVTIGSDGGIPTIGNRVSIRTGAVVVGPIFIGDDASILANAVVSEDMPNGYCAYAPRTVFKPRKTKPI